MEMDKELLLNVNDSDSDEVVEEFKLPPPRTRRPKARKALAEARIAASNQAVVSWKCCLIFLMLTIFLTGALALAYLILSMQAEIAKLEEDLVKVKIQVDRGNALSTTTKKFGEAIEEHKVKFSQQDVNFRLLSHQMKSINKTIEKIKSSTGTARQIAVLATDVDSLKSGMASSGGQVDKLHAQLEEHSDRFGSILTELKDVKMALYKATTKNKTTLASLTQPISAQTQEIRKLKEVIRKMNVTLKGSTQKIANELYSRNVEFDEKVHQLGLKVDLFNLTSVNQRASADTQMVALKKSVAFLFNETGTMKTQILKQIGQYGDYLQLRSDVLRCKNMSELNSLKIRAMSERVDKHHSRMSNYSNLRGELENIQRMIVSHHQQLERMQKESTRHTSQTSQASQASQTTPTLQTSHAHTNGTSTKSISVSASVTTTSIPETTTSRVLPTDGLVTPSSNNSSDDSKLGGCSIPCDKTERCLPSQNGFKCACADGFRREGKYCEDIDECRDPITVKLCHVNATCFNTFGSFECRCAEGFVGNGTVCIKLPEFLLRKNSTGLPSGLSTTGPLSADSTRPNVSSSPVSTFTTGASTNNSNHPTGLPLASSTQTTGSLESARSNSSSSGVSVRPTVSSSGNRTRDSNRNATTIDHSTTSEKPESVRTPETPDEKGRYDSSKSSLDDQPGTTEKPESLRTPEMPDEKGLYDNDKSSLADEEAKREADKIYRQRSPADEGRGSWSRSRGINLLKRLLRQRSEKKLSEKLADMHRSPSSLNT